jgi:hypothetical protein
MVIRFTFTDWLAGMGIQNTFVLIGVIAIALSALPVAFMVYGKGSRVRSAARYEKYASRQQAQRAI